MPTPLAGFDAVNDPKTDSLGWHVPLNLQSFGGLLDVTNQTDLDYQLWANDTDYLGTIPAWTAYVKINFHGLYTYVNFRPSGFLYTQNTVSETVKGALYQLGEPAPSTITVALPRQTYPIRQERHIAVPMAMSRSGIQGMTLAAGLIVELFPWNPSAAQLARSIALAYIYYLSIDASSVAAGTVANAFSIDLVWKNGGGTIVGGPFDLVVGRVVANTTQGDHWSYNPHHPLLVNPGISGVGANNAVIRLRVTTSSGANSASLNWAIDADVNDLTPLTDIGDPTARWTPQGYEQIGIPFPFF